MNIEEFLLQCNKTPLLKDYRLKNGVLKKELLKSIDFLKSSYEVKDLLELTGLLLGFKLPEEPRALKKVFEAKREAKDLQHQRLIKNFDNQEFIMQIRKELEMPFENKGFLIKKNEPKTKLELDLELAESYKNMDFNFSPEFESWFFRNSKNKEDYDEWDKASILNEKIISIAINKIIKKWTLPKRYENAIRELLLFNRIIPASSGIKWLYTRQSDETFQDGLSWDIDTPKEEIIETIKEDQYKILKKRSKYLQSKVRRGVSRRKSEETEKLIKVYNQYKKNGKKQKEIFEIIQFQFRSYNLSISAIRKRIKGK